MTVAAIDAVLAARGLFKTYGKGKAAVRAVDGVDVELTPGEIVAVMGASGSGKTTLLHLLAGLVRPDAGSIRLAGEDLASLSDAAATQLRGKRMGVVFQAYNLMPTLSALDNVALPLLLAGVGRRRARETARDRLEIVGMAHSVDRRPPHLSGGEQQRVAVARALVNDPQVVLADEPTGNLDRRNVRAVCELFRNVAVVSHRAVAVVTHELIVAEYADRIIVLADGRVADSFPRDAFDTLDELSIRCARIASDEN